MKKVHIIAHTHWDYEWYFTRQEARVQFAYHLNEVLKALANNQIDYYLVDGQMAIIDDYLEANPEKKNILKRFVSEGRLFIGPWYTQIDELITSGESIIRNLQLGLKEANSLGGAMKVGYLPDSFGQSQDMPKIYQGFGIDNAVFWRGIPRDKNARYFYWSSDDSSKVLVTEIRNSYAVGADLIDTDNYMDVLHKITTNTDLQDLVLPVGGDQRPVDFNLKKKLNYINGAQNEFRLIEDNYPSFFNQIKANTFPDYKGEFISPTVSKIHRGIYSSRADIKHIYDRLTNMVVNEVEPLMAIAKTHGIEPQTGMISLIWKTISRGMAHDSSGGCNSDETNSDIKHRGIVALQMADALKCYLLRKLSSNTDGTEGNLFFWNVLPYSVKQIAVTELSTKSKNFSLYNKDKKVPFEVLDQKKVDASNIRRNDDLRNHQYYYLTKISLPIKISALDWVSLLVKEDTSELNYLVSDNKFQIENVNYKIWINDGTLNLIDKNNNDQIDSFLSFEDGGDEGDTYDYSPAYKDWIMHLSFEGCTVKSLHGHNINQLIIQGNWLLPNDLNERAKRSTSIKEEYVLKIVLKNSDPIIYYNLKINNKVKDHRIRLLLKTPIKSEYSYADTAFGYVKRPVNDKDLDNWKELGLHEEPTSLRPMIHYVNLHNQKKSWSYLSEGQKAYQVINNNVIAVTMFRCVGYQGRPDLLRRPSDASGLINKWVQTMDAQLQGDRHIRGGILISNQFNPAEIQKRHHSMVSPVLSYQNQEINEYTNPLQHFRINALAQKLEHNSVFALDAPQLICSSLYLSEDKNGFILRLYNPNKYEISNPGSINLKVECSLADLNLNNQIQKSLGTYTDKVVLSSFRPGEIKTYGIFPISK